MQLIGTFTLQFQHFAAMAIQTHAGQPLQRHDNWSLQAFEQVQQSRPSRMLPGWLALLHSPAVLIYIAACTSPPVHVTAKSWLALLDWDACCHGSMLTMLL